MKYGVDCGCTAMPIANYTASVSSPTVSFTYTGTTTPIIDSVRWDFGDGTTSTLLNPTHIYSAAGTFTACIRVYTSCGRDLYCNSVVIPCPYTPVASFTDTGVYVKGFTYTGTTAGMDSVRWYFGDGGTSTATNPIHTYLTTGTFTVCVTMYTWCASNTYCATINVPCVGSPTSAFTITGTGTTKSFTYTGTTVALDSVKWNFGDGSPTALGLTPSHTYATIGTYTVCATVYTRCGSHTICHTVNVPCTTAPVASATYTGSFAIKNFTYTGTTVGLDSVRWDFGDGGTTTGLSPTHTYVSIGTFLVCVSAYNGCGWDSVCYTVSVPCLGTPSASFTAVPGGDSIRNFTYTGTTVGVDSIVWQFGDGSGFTGTPATHTYTDTGFKIVCVIAYSQCGNDTTCTTIHIGHPLFVPLVTLTDIKVYPNPVTHQLIVENADGSVITINDLLGKRMFTTAIGNKKETLTIGSLAPGVYILSVTTPDGNRSNVKLIKE